MTSLEITIDGPGPPPPDPSFTAVWLVLMAVWLVTFLNALSIPSGAWDGANQRKWLVLVATIMLGPITGPVAYWCGFRGTLKRRAHAGGYNDLRAIGQYLEGPR